VVPIFDQVDEEAKYTGFKMKRHAISIKLTGLRIDPEFVEVVCAV